MCLAGAALLLPLMAVGAGTPQDKPTPDPARFADAIRIFERWDRKNTPASDAVLFVGSSSIRMWMTRASFPELPVINRGFGGSHISDVIYYAERIVLPYKAKAIVFYAGDNDVADGKSPERVRDDFQTFIRLVHKAQPNVPIVYLPIKPSVSRWAHWPKMREANALIQAMCKADPSLTYVDTATPLLGSDGKPRADLLLKDGLHLNEDGYAVWTRVLKPVLERLMK
jgi:lysophospholipase L1-like esterase